MNTPISNLHCNILLLNNLSANENVLILSTITLFKSTVFFPFFHLNTLCSHNSNIIPKYYNIVLQTILTAVSNTKNKI